MYYFNYNDYIKTIHTINLNNISLLAEEKTKYTINQREERYRNFIKQTLHNKLIISKIINIFLSEKRKILSNNLKLYSKINSKVYNYNSTIFYLKQNPNIFFLIIYQNKIDTNLQYKTLVECINIIKKLRKLNNSKQNKLPIVVPIIIYIGKEKWNIQKEIKEFKTTTFRKNNINFNYNFIDINKAMKNREVKEAMEELICIENFRL